MRRKRRVQPRLFRYLGSASICLGFVAVVAHAVTATAVEIDHFLCYEAEGDEVAAVVSLGDQSGTAHQVEVEEPDVFCNPVIKGVGDEVTEIADPTAHLVGYEVERVVLVANQFGEQTLTIEDAQLLLVPSEKNGVPSDLNLDHFKCYEAEGDEVKLSVDLADQFGVLLDVLVEEPKLFCKPVDKEGEGILDPDARLTCYEIEEDLDSSEDLEEDAEREVLVDNQFGGQVLGVDEAELLCVPSDEEGHCGLGFELPLMLTPLMLLRRKRRG